MSKESQKQTKKAPERRVYVVVPRNVRPDPDELISIPMECGRLMAQVAHVVSKLKLRNKLDPDEEYTTIILQVLDDRDLITKWDRLIEQDIPVEIFFDTNEEFYGTDRKIPTAIATLLTHKKGKKYFWDLPLWKCNK